MNIKKYISSQLRCPSGLFGRFITLDFLNRHNGKLNSLACRSIQLQPDDQVLEIGFGGGALMSEIAEVVTQGHITGVDFSKEAVKVCSKRFRLLIDKGLMDLHCASVDSLPLPAEKFTKVCAVNVIYFWPDPVSALQQIHRVLKKNGLLVIGFKSRSILKGNNLTEYGFMLYEPNEVETLLKTAGFREVLINIEGEGQQQCITAQGWK